MPTCVATQKQKHFVILEDNYCPALGPGQCWTIIILQNPDRWGRQKEGFAEATTRPTQRAQCVCKGRRLKRSTGGVCTDGDFLTETQPSASLTFQVRCKSGLPKSSTTVESNPYSNEYANRVVLIVFLFFNFLKVSRKSERW